MDIDTEVYDRDKVIEWVNQDLGIEKYLEIQNAIVSEIKMLRDLAFDMSLPDDVAFTAFDIIYDLNLHLDIIYVKIKETIKETLNDTIEEKSVEIVGLEEELDEVIEKSNDDSTEDESYYDEEIGSLENEIESLQLEIDKCKIQLIQLEKED